MSIIDNNYIEIKENDLINISDFTHILVDFSYNREKNITDSGQFDIVGGNIIIWPVNRKEVIIIELFGNNVEKIIDFNNHKIIQTSVIIPANNIKYDDGTSIKPDDYIVHIDHGIGIFRGIGLKKVNDEEKPYAFIEYRNTDYLYLPLKLKNNITYYLGSSRKPKLNKLGTGAWAKSKKRAYDNVLKLARELVEIYASREIAISKPYTIEKTWHDKISQSFGYRETVDQEKAIRDVYNDLISSKPMDRLISGDVGFGKTEVALRAMIQAIANGKQVAFICPTTILAQQHFTNIQARSGDLPIRIEVLSRFVDRENQSKIVRDINLGLVDLVIGTHRLFSKDLKFKNLDLIIIDEEQKFGVKQKEIFKKMRYGLNVLAMSATPIPRTLFMSLSGIRDISEIRTTPVGRKDINTFVTPYSDEVIEKYICRELKRGGQIYYLHNKLDTIGAVANKLGRLIPRCKIGIAHGQLPEKKLSAVMDKFLNREVDLLLCSTIIENGLDLPNVNTLIVEEADMFGLSQLYQIRGRIGRSSRQAHCLLTHKHKKISAVAHKRLKAMMEFTALGSGINISMNDLEIRGGGNILGREQHGNMDTIGILLYGQMLKQAVQKIKAIANN